MSTTVIVDCAYLPKVTLTVEDSGRMEAVIEVDGLEPVRGTNASERTAGITSLDPPTVNAFPRSDRSKTHRALIDASWRAVSAAATSTLGETGGPGGILMLLLRTTYAVRRALRLADEAI